MTLFHFTLFIAKLHKQHNICIFITTNSLEKTHIKQQFAVMKANIGNNASPFVTDSDHT